MTEKDLEVQRLRAENARLFALDPIGQVLGEIAGLREGDSIRFDMKGDFAGVNYHLKVE